MRYNDDIERSAEYLRLALPLMSRQAAALTPIAYAIWYEYVAGINPALQTRINELIQGGGVLDDDQTVDLFRRYVADIDHETVRRVGQDLQKVMFDVSRSAAQTGEKAGEFGNALQILSVGLSDTPDASQIAATHIATLLEHTQDMQGSVATLKTRLDDSQREIEELRQEVDRAREEALADGLTGLSNRRGFDIALTSCLSTLTPGTQAPCLLIADIDHFKSVNDRYGHLLGDKVIRAVAQILKESVKGRDTAARYGGEEFTVLLPNTPIEGARALAEQIRALTENCRIRRLDSHESIESITLSFGVASLHAGETADELLTRADRALYQSKQNGRNCVTVADD
ncbi:MAG: GGDEF domain-containing protein [Gammaproteobacteria bacterium]|nr:GGDEF domain-containing protein [Gammaproteobacteria bacterium]MBU1416389.1 GGDEF domain-containing protein [Gammaproteobacteria bacterium]